MPGTCLPRLWQHDPTLDVPARYRRACRYQSFLPTTLKELDFSLGPVTAGLVAGAEQAIRALNAAPAERTPMARLLLRMESIASCRLDGMRTGIRELVRAEAGLETEERSEPATREARATMELMALAIDRTGKGGPWTVADIRSLHRRLRAGAINARRVAGVVRTSQNWIGGNYWNPCGARFVPPPPEEVPRLLIDLCNAINDDRLPPLVQAALVHAQFEAIHPFSDGNGRTGRALIHAVLRRRGVATAHVPPISLVLAAARQRYLDGLTRFRADGVAEWIEQFAGAAARAARLASQYLDEVGRLADTWRRKLAASPDAPRLDATAWKIIDILPAHPIITAPVAAATTARSKPQVYQALGQLETAGVLQPLSASHRNRAWEAAGLLDLLDGLEAASA